MSITDELRKYATNDCLHYCSDYLAIADRIDAEHESACAEAYGNGVKSVALPDLTAYVKLPVDADGEYIHIGDLMAYEDNTKPMEVVALVPPAVFLTEDGPRYADMCRHYHAPTVEDVLREFFEEVGDGLHTLKAVDTQVIIAKYAAKLRLAEGKDA